MTQPDGDRICELPDNVIDCILQHLIVKDLIRTSILSRKWRYRWTCVPRLEFDEEFYNLFKNVYEFSRIISEILSLHNGPINEFILLLPENKITFEYLNNWFLVLSRKCVKSITLLNDETYFIQTPSHIFSCLGLIYFKCHRIYLSIPSSFRGFKSLLHLGFEDMTFELGALNRLLSTCPLLEKLAIEHCSGYDCIDLSSSSALIDLTLSLPQNCTFVGLPKIQRLKLVLLGEMLLYTDNFPLSQLIMSLKYLCLDEVNLDGREELLYIVSVLKSASNLVELHIVTDNDSAYKVQAPDPSEKLECSSSCLSQLEKVKIRVQTGFKHAMSLTRFILANSSSLKTLTFGFRYHSKPETSILSSISKDLLWMERASQRAQVEFLHQ
ncbi:F-box/FBD/LRR-repeat protein At1g13570-like [Vicia villosa]|uniref:F-box/FBD/LRR-repeat protein At1g13570-like n=1 Tax=Vicia villosa TaxID=3911 RepID=UPI00273AE5C9|nr:F-box/FBD/LRR-repeat protein At1g13570-like [Vicia villosa]